MTLPKMRFKPLGIVLGVFIFTLVFSVALQSLLADWTVPTATPPGNNTAKPIDTSIVGQLKQGGLVLNTIGVLNGLIVALGNVGFGTLDPKAPLDVNGEVKIGSSGLLCNSDTKGAIRYNDNNNRMYYCNSIVWKLFSTDIPYNQFITYNNESDYIQEDLKQSCVKFVVDTANTSGHFTNTSGAVQTVGNGNNCSKIVVGTRFQIGSDWYDISSIIGNGAANNGVFFSGAKAVGTYPVNFVYATQITNGVVKLNGEGSLYGDGSYSGNVMQSGSVVQPKDYYIKNQTAVTGVPLKDYTGGNWRVDRDLVLTPGKTISYLGVFNSVSETQYVSILKKNGTTYTVVKKYPLTTSVMPAQYQYFELATPFVVPNDGSTYLLGLYSPTTMYSSFSYNGHSGNNVAIYTSNLAEGASATFSETTGYTTFLGLIYSTSIYRNAVVVTGAATVAPDSITGASVVMADNIVIDGASASLQPSTNSKGLIVYAKSGVSLLNGGKLNIDKLGKAGNFGNLTAYDLTPDSLKNKVNQNALAAYVVQGEGAAGGIGYTIGYHAGYAGSAASAMQTGGGGSGGHHGDSGTVQKGGKGGPCCGGAATGGYWVTPGGGGTGPACGDYGGPGGDGADNVGGGGGGAGNPVGAGAHGGTPGQGAGGGLLMVFSPSVSVGAGSIVSSDGAAGGTVSGNYAGGGGAGGGIVTIITSSGGYTNNGIVRASGGPGGAGAIGGPGGPGGNGSVNTFTSSAIGGIPTYIYSTVIMSVPFDAASWSGMSPATVTENLNSGKSFYSISFDNKNSFKVYNSGWRTIASNKNSDHGGVNGDWYYRDNANNWIAAYDNSANAAISQAMGAGTNNQMSGVSFANISSANWTSTGGFVAGQEFFDVATTLYSPGASSNPAVDQITLIVN